MDNQCRKHTPMAGVDLDLGMDRGMWLQSAASALSVLPLLEKTPCSNGFHRLQFKGLVHCFLPSFTLYHPSFHLLLYTVPLLFYTSPIARKT